MIKSTAAPVLMGPRIRASLPVQAILIENDRREINVTEPDLDGEIRGGRHHLAVRVYYEDTDFSGVTYHANYLRFMERGRTNYLRLLGTNHRDLFEETQNEAPGFAFVVR